MSTEDERVVGACAACGARAVELRRGRCWGCYVQWQETREVGLGALCESCEEPRRDQLRYAELFGRSVVLCFACAGRAARLEPPPRTLEALRMRLDRDRRWGDRRLDPEAGGDRGEQRLGDRRMVVDGLVLVDVLDATALAIEELVDDAPPPGDETRILGRPPAPPSDADPE